MKLIKKIVIPIIIFAIIVSVIWYWFVKKQYGNIDEQTVTTNILRLYNTSDPEITVNISDYVFIGKVNKILRTEYRNPVKVELDFYKTITQKTPYTIYEINVIENIKGNLIMDNPIEVVQYGGINESGKSYTVAKDAPLLNEDEYYLFMISVSSDTNELESSDKNRTISLGKNFEEIDNDLVDSYKKLIVSDENRIDFFERKFGNVDDDLKETYRKLILPDTNELTSNHISKYDINYQNKSYIEEDGNPDISQMDKENKEKEEEFKKIFIKYYGQEELEKIFTAIKQETSEYSENNPGKYVFPENGKILLRKTIDLINNANTSDTEKDILKYVIDGMDFSTLQDKELLNELELVGIDLDYIH